MSNLNRDIAFNLKKGDVLYHNIIAFGGTEVPENEKEIATCKVIGPAKKHPIYGYQLPVRQQYGEKVSTSITEYTQTLWRTTPEKPARVTRVRRAVQEELQEVASRSARRVHRTRR
jgi:hypothetical protein